jgi:multidrug efflux pump
LPLALAHGAGSASQNAIGIGVIGGMLSATFLATFMIPMFYVVVADKLGRKRPQGQHADTDSTVPAVAGEHQ